MAEGVVGGRRGADVERAAHEAPRDERRQQRTQPDAREPGRLEPLSRRQRCGGEEREAGEQSGAMLAESVAEHLQALLALPGELRAERAQDEGEQQTAR
jgi:hypothetical protein